MKIGDIVRLEDEAITLGLKEPSQKEEQALVTIDDHEEPIDMDKVEVILIN